MSHSSLAIAGVLALSLSALPVVQERASQRKKADFPTTLKAVGESWNAGRYANCLAGLRELTQMATIQRAQTIRAALPEPAGWKIEEDISTFIRPFVLATSTRRRTLFILCFSQPITTMMGSPSLIQPTIQSY